MTEQEVKKKVNKAINMLLNKDIYLLQVDANERTVCHRLAVYLERFFPEEWDVDCEYNRRGGLPKQLHFVSDWIASCDETIARTVYPDIIIHQRGTDKNLLVIEVKKTTSYDGDDFDFVKLKAYKSEIGYEFAVFMKIMTNAPIINFADVKQEWIV